MAYGDSLRQYVLGLAKRLYWLLPALVSDPLDIWERLLDVTIAVPPSIGWGLVGVGFLIASLLTFHEQRQRTQKVAKQKEIVERQGNAGLPVTEIPLDWLSDDGQQRRMAQAGMALQDMALEHGHADDNGIMEAVRIGRSFNAEPCWICGKPRFGWRPDGSTSDSSKD